MATTYNSSATPLDRARRILGDTGVDGNTFLLTDEEIEAELQGEAYNAAIGRLALGLATRFAQYPDDTTTPGGHKMKWSDRVRAWEALSDRMQRMKSPGVRQRKTMLGNLTNPTTENNKLR
jgi:hypothetical protein